MAMPQNDDYVESYSVYAGRKRQKRSEDRFSLINRRNVNGRHFTRTLISEALRVGLLPIEVVDDMQMQIMGKLEELLREHKKSTGIELDEDGARHLLESVFYTLDTYLLAFHDPMYAITAVQATSVEEMFRGGRQQIKTQICETVSLYIQAKKNRIPTENTAYQGVLNEDIHTYLNRYDYRMAAQDIVCPLRYPLMTDCSPDHTGISYLRDYLQRLYIENELLALFDPEERDLLFSAFAAKHDMTVEGMRVNLLSLILNHAFGASMLGKYPGILTLTEPEVRILYEKLYRKTTRELGDMAAQAADTLITDFHITDGLLIGYVRTAGRIFAGHLVSARNAREHADLFVPTDPTMLFRS
ncbi:MAG: DUF6179 domain-containing protein [Clostridia bacterium]|nr:DUF6179 domain-containing protein [Clostridia bacterium]